MPSNSLVAYANEQRMFASYRPRAAQAKLLIYGIDDAKYSHEAVEVDVASMEIHQEEYKHDVAIIRVRPNNSLRKALRHLRPVKLRWGYSSGDGGRSTFYGYVHSTDFEHRPGRRLMEVTLIGATYRMRTRRNKLWLDDAATYPVLWHAERHYFGVYTQNKRLRRFRRLMQTTRQTDWQFLVEVAQRSGCTLYNKGTSLRLYRRDSPPDRLYRFAPVFDVRRREIRRFHITEGLDGGNVARPDMLSDLLRGVRAGTSSDGWFYDPISRENGLAYIASNNAELLSVDQALQISDGYSRADSARVMHYGRPQSPSSSPSQDTTSFIDRITDNGWHPDSLGELMDELRAHRRLNSRPYKARARLAGNPKVHQGMVVNLLGLDRGSGLWYVEKVEHKLTTDRYYMDCILSKESLDEDSRRPWPIWVSPLVPMVPVDPPVSSRPDPSYTSPDPTNPFPIDLPVLVLPEPPLLPTNPTETEDGTSPFPTIPGDFGNDPADGSLVIDEDVLMHRAPSCPVQSRPFNSSGEWRSKVVGITQWPTEDDS